MVKVAAGAEDDCSFVEQQLTPMRAGRNDVIRWFIEGDCSDKWKLEIVAVWTNEANEQAQLKDTTSLEKLARKADPERYDPLVTELQGALGDTPHAWKYTVTLSDGSGREARRIEGMLFLCPSWPCRR